MMRAFTIVFMLQLSLISVSLGEQKKWSGSEADWKAYYAYLDYQDSEAAKKYSKDKQDNGDTNEESDNRTNCGIGRICDRCDHFKHILVGENYEKVCCKSCSEHFIAGNYEDGDKTIPHCACIYDKIKGDCWKGLACSACDKTVVGNIKGVPVCCENCEKSGIRYGLEGKYSTCG